MSRGFYERLGVSPGASAGTIRAAYGVAVTDVGRRRQRLVEQGGDPTELDHERARLDEAWRTLQDPSARRRYDALREWVALADAPRSGDALWQWVAPRVTSPAAAVAVKLLRSVTRLERLAPLPLAPSPSEADPPTLVPHNDDLTQPRAEVRRMGPSPSAPANDGAPVIAMPVPRAARRKNKVVTLPGATPPGPTLRVVDGSPSAPEVLVLPVASTATGDRRVGSTDLPSGARPADPPRPAPAARSVSAEDVARLVDAHGYGGSLLRAVREARGLSLDQIAADTRISLKYLEALEGDDFGRLPSATFVRGYVKQVARKLRLDVDAVVAGYMRRLQDS